MLLTSLPLSLSHIDTRTQPNCFWLLHSVMLGKVKMPLFAGKAIIVICIETGPHCSHECFR